MEKRKSPSHYEVLRVPQTASPREIKAAHRALVLQCHPDKQLDGYGHGHGHVHEDSDEFFRIQRAWECLRDPDRREEYNQNLNRVLEKDQNQVRLSSIVYVSQMNREVCQIETEDDVATWQSILFTYPCRCGDEFQILGDDLNESAIISSSARTINARVISCPSCTLSIQVIHDLSNVS